MSGYNGPPVQPKALWTWSAPVSGQPAQVVSFPTVQGAPTKSGLTGTDLANYMLIPLVYGQPPVPIPAAVITNWIRMAEDDIETKTNVRLCQTWVAAPAAKTNAQVQALNLATAYKFEQPGIDYDYEEAGYDFFF